MGLLKLTILIGSIQGVLLGAIFLSRRNGLSGKLLAAALFMISVALFQAYLLLAVDLRDHRYLIKINLIFPLLFMPLIFLYLKSIVGSLHTTLVSRPLVFCSSLDIARLQLSLLLR